MIQAGLDNRAPHEALREWKRVVRMGGSLSISMPTEGRLTWNSGRHLTTWRLFRKKGLDHDYFIARKHINACHRLVVLIERYFSRGKARWFPLGVPSMHLNLICNFTMVNE